MVTVVLLALAFASHVLPHPWWNFTAVGGALLVWGARRPLPTVALPVALLAAGDWYLTRFVYGYPFHVGAYLLTWTWYVAAVVLGRLLLRNRPGAPRAAGAAVLASTSFFAVSNYAVWAQAGSWYPHTLAGLETCYAMALPFYRNDLLSTLIVVGVVFGLIPLMVPTPAKSAAARTRA